jgi:replicative superfamily II helicase
MRRCLLNGVAIHHAGLLLEERKLIEEAARSKTLSVIVATTTLSAGVNIHSVSRVLIMSISRTAGIGKQERMPASQFTQMVGRAGRAEGIPGSAIVFARQKHPNEIAEIEKLSTLKIPDIVPHLRDEGQLERFYLQALAVELVDPETGVGEFLSRTFKIDEGADDTTAHATARLMERGLIGPDQCPTQVGRAIAGSSLSIEDGLQMAEIVKQMQTDLCLDDEVHLLYLCVSAQTASEVSPPLYNSQTWLTIFEQHKHVIRLITNLDDRTIDHIQDRPGIYGGSGRVNKVLDAQLDRIYVAAIMHDFVDEKPMQEIARRFKIERGTIQSLQMKCASFAGQVSKFCELFGAGLLAATLTKFRQRLNFGARTELIGLLVLPSITKTIAQRLASKGMTSAMDLANLNVEAIAALIGESDDRTTAEQILQDATEYTESLTRIEEFEESAVQHFS